MSIAANDMTAGLGLGDSGQNQFLTFMLGGEEYGVNILSVQEIKSGDNLTPIPKTPVYIKGVMNLRGQIVPVVDLRERFSIGAREGVDRQVVVILNVDSGDRHRTVGVIVDDVSDVYSLDEEQIKDSPDFGSAIDTEYIRGIATIDDNIVIVLNSDRLFNLEELSRMDDLEAPSAD